MVQNEKEKKGRIDFYRVQGFDEVATAIEEEFFWHIDGCLRELSRIGFDTKVIRFSDLSFGISATKITPNKTGERNAEIAPLTRHPSL